MPGSVKIGAIIKQARLAEGLTQTQLADRLGIAQSTVAAVEAGTQGLGLDLLDALEIILGITVVYVPDD